MEGYKAVDCDDNFIFAIYSGRTRQSHGGKAEHCEHLLVYDWEGNPVKRYILCVAIHTMRYNKENNCIYGLAENPEGVLVEYQL